MTATRTIRLTCDEQDCMALFSSNDRTTAAVRQAARAHGWRYRSGHPAATEPDAKDLCPRHAVSRRPEREEG